MSTCWRLGDVVVHKIVEEVAAYTPPEHFFPRLVAHDATRILAPYVGRGYDPVHNLVELSYHSYLVQTPEFTVLIDACVGNDKSVPLRSAWHQRSSRAWLDDLASTGVSIDDVDYVVCTHLHLDHVGWNTVYRGGWQPTFPRARYLFVRAEYEWTKQWPSLHEGADPLGLTPTFAASFAESIAPLEGSGQLELVEQDHRIGRYLRFLPTPGHTPGHTAYGVGRDVDLIVFTGDIVHSPAQVQKPELATAADEDLDLATAARIRLFESVADSGALMATMHFPGTSVGRLERVPGGFAFRER